MKYLLRVMLVLAFSLSLTGCLKMHVDSTIEKDGSGTAVMEVGLTTSVAKALKEMQELDPNSSDDMPALDEIRKDRIEEAIKPYDVKLTEFERTDTDSTQFVHLAFAFKDLKGLSAAMAATLDEEGGEGMGIFEAPDGNFVLKKAVYDFSDMPPPPAKPEKETPTPTDQQPSPEQMQKSMELMGVLMGAMAELDIRMKITVPGDIIETNAPTQDGRTSIWTINASNMMTQQQDMAPEIKFSSKGLQIKPLKE